MLSFKMLSPGLSDMKIEYIVKVIPLYICDRSETQIIFDVPLQCSVAIWIEGKQG
jgi:hypothetical protein